MLLYKDGRFYGERVSFAIPEGFYVEDDRDVTDEYGFCAWDPEREYLCCWRFYWDCGDTKEELAKWFCPDCGITPLSEIAPIQINGLRGHSVLYQTRSEQYYEARFDLGEGEEFALLVETRGQNIRRIIESPTFKCVLEGIQAGETRERFFRFAGDF